MSNLFNEFHFSSTISHIPSLVWIKNQNLNYVACSQKVIDFVGLCSKEALMHKNDYALPWAKYAELYRAGDKQVLERGKTMSFLHPVCLPNHTEVLIVTHKSPFLDTAKNIIGVYGHITIVSAPHKVQKIYNLLYKDRDIADLSLRQPLQYQLSNDFEFSGLSKRETICLFYFIRGKTAKETADILNISKRTVEKHFEFIKHKLNCKTKSEVFSKAIEQGFLYLIPSNYLLDKIF